MWRALKHKGFQAAYLYEASVFSKKTVFVIGAGASGEFRMPVGSALMQDVARTVGQGSGQNKGEHAFRTKVARSLGSNNIDRLMNEADRLAKTIPQFNSMDEVLHFLSDSPAVVELGKLAIAHEILKAERASLLYAAMQGDREAIQACDNTWAERFLRMALSATRKKDISRLFENVIVIDFNYDRILPQHLFLSLQRSLSIPHEEAAECVKGLSIIHPYGMLGPLEWQAENNSVPFADENADLAALSTGIRTYTEELGAPQISDIKAAINQADAFVILGFGFHKQNIELLTIAPPREINNAAVFMTVYGIGSHNTNAVADTIQAALRTHLIPRYLSEEARQLMGQLNVSIALAVS